MKTIFTTMAALSALSVAAPALAQSGPGHRTQSGELRMQIDAGVRTGAISRREMQPLRNSLRQLIGLERQFGINGISGREHATLRQRGALLRQQIATAERSGYGRNGRADWSDRNDGKPGFASNGRFDRPNRGDRFAGDVRVGQRASARMLALPERYRDEFRDGNDVYYRYDDRRIYQIDRRSHLIMALLDMEWNDGDDRRDPSSMEGRFDGPNRGDRFNGDVRVGQRSSLRMRALPEQYRAEFRDSNDYYYRYDDSRIYQIDRRTDLILGLLDIM
jgi:hypothetical protein